MPNKDAIDELARKYGAIEDEDPIEALAKQYGAIDNQNITPKKSLQADMAAAGQKSQPNKRSLDEILGKTARAVDNFITGTGNALDSKPGEGAIRRGIKGPLRTGYGFAAMPWQISKAAALPPKDQLEASLLIGPNGEAALASKRLVIDPMAQEFENASEAWKNKHPIEATRHAIGGVIPMIGPYLNQLITRAEKGDFAGSITEGITSFLLPKLSKLAPKKLPIFPKITNYNSKTAAAVNAAMKEGVPVDAATATGSTPVRALQWIADKSLPGGFIADKVKQGEAAAVANWGRKLANKVRPGAQITMDRAGESVRNALVDSLIQEGNNLSGQIPGRTYTPLQAGESLRNAFNRQIHNLKEESDVMYGKFREIANLPENIKQIGPAEIKRLPEYVMMEGNKLPLGNLLPEQIAALEQNGIIPSGPKSLIEMENFGTPANPVFAQKPRNVAIPVDMSPIKKTLEPIFQHWSQWIQPAARNASQGYQAMKSILAGPDWIDAADAEAGLSGLKSLAREARSPDMANASQGMGKFSTALFQKAIDEAVAQATEGQKALQYLRAGRMKHAQKMGISEIERRLREEPVQTMQQMTYGKDSGINLLRKTSQLFPDEMPNIGRSLMEDMLAEATSGGGFDKAQSLFSKWQNLGPETKKLIFRDPSLMGELDNYFKQIRDVSGLRKEPVQVVQQLIQSNDSGISLLKNVQKQAPNEMTKIGRAFIDDLITQSTEAGGFDKADSLFSKWNKVGPETKKIIFEDPNYIKNLDDFFLFAKKRAENPNTSGSGFTAIQGGQMLYFFQDPTTATFMAIGSAALAKALHSPKVVKVLLNGLKVPVNQKLTAAVSGSALMGAVGRAATPISKLQYDMARQQSSKPDRSVPIPPGITKRYGRPIQPQR
jgi:hypothetical protein